MCEGIVLAPVDEAPVVANSDSGNRPAFVVDPCSLRFSEYDEATTMASAKVCADSDQQKQRHQPPKKTQSDFSAVESPSDDERMTDRRSSPPIRGISSISGRHTNVTRRRQDDSSAVDVTRSAGNCGKMRSAKSELGDDERVRPERERDEEGLRELRCGRVPDSICVHNYSGTGKADDEDRLSPCVDPSGAPADDATALELPPRRQHQHLTSSKARKDLTPSNISDTRTAVVENADEAPHRPAASSLSPPHHHHQHRRGHHHPQHPAAASSASHRHLSSSPAPAASISPDEEVGSNEGSGGPIMARGGAAADALAFSSSSSPHHQHDEDERRQRVTRYRRPSSSSSPPHQERTSDAARSPSPPSPAASSSEGDEEDRLDSNNGHQHRWKSDGNANKSIKGESNSQADRDSEDSDKVAQTWSTMGVRSFGIADILQHEPSAAAAAAQFAASAQQAQSFAAMRLMDPATLELYRRHALATAATAAAAAAAAAASGLAMSPSAAAAAASLSSPNNPHHLQHNKPNQVQPQQHSAAAAAASAAASHHFQQQLPLLIQQHQQQQHHHHLHLHQHHPAAMAAAAAAMASSAGQHPSFPSHHPAAAAAAALMALGPGGGGNTMSPSAAASLFGQQGFMSPNMAADLTTMQALMAAQRAGRLPSMLGPSGSHLPFDFMMGMKSAAGSAGRVPSPASCRTPPAPATSKASSTANSNAPHHQQPQKIVRPWDMDAASAAASSRLSSPPPAHQQNSSARALPPSDAKSHQQQHRLSLKRRRHQSGCSPARARGTNHGHGSDLDSSCEDNPDITGDEDEEEEIAVEDEDDNTMTSAITTTNSACSSPSGNDNDRGTPRHHGGSKSEAGASSGRNATKRSADGSSPLDALFKMTSKTFEEDKGDPMTMFANSRQQQANNKKKRKSRTAFTNHQIFELEKRFLYQKYLSPADRDELAQALGLSNAQVITWFQNRRAKLKRDMEELKKDVESSRILKVHKAYLDNIQELGLSKIKMDKNSHELTLGKIKFNRESLLQHAERELHALRHPPPTADDLVAATKLNLL